MRPSPIQSALHEFHEHPQLARNVHAAGIIKIEPWEGWPPRLQQRDQTPGLNVLLYLDFECAGNAAAGPYSVQEDIAIIGYDWADSLDVEITPPCGYIPSDRYRRRGEH
jgi:hypothetical protein